MLRQDLTIICFACNLSKIKGLDRLDRSLLSLREQKSGLHPEIMVVDVSNDGSDAEIDKICERRKATHFHIFLEGVKWSMPRAFNFGIKNSNTTYVMTTGVDFLFAPNFIEEVEKRKSSNKLLLCKIYKAPKKCDLSGFSAAQYENIRGKSSFVKEDWSNGACQLTTKAWFEKVKGYDEKLLMWSGVDNDLVNRARWSGLKIDWLNNTTSIVHQFHPEFKIKDKIGKKCTKINRSYLLSKNKRRQVIANKEGDWGKLVVKYSKKYD
jgi:GT2 family glycosyltransferase